MKHLKSLVIVATSLVLIGVACTKSDTTTDATLAGNWVKSVGFDGNGRAGAVSFVIGDIAYVGTGFDGTNRYNDFWAFNANTGSWSQIAPMPGVKRNSAAAFAAAGKGYVVTGYDGVNKLQDNWEYNVAANTWAGKMPLPDPANSTAGSGARYGAVGFGIADTGYICSGYTGSHTKDLWRYDAINDNWAQRNSMNTSDKRTGAIAFVYGGEAYIVSGSNNGSVVTEMAKYTPSTGNWTKKRDIANISTDSYDDNYNSIVRSNAVGFVIGNKGYLTTGENGSNIKTTWEYNFADDLWTAVTSFERSDRNSAVGFTVKGKGYVATGRNSTQYLDNMDEFRPTETYNAND
jgi:hypothetical protein